MRDEDQADAEAEKERGEVDVQLGHGSGPIVGERFAKADRLIGPLATFSLIYLATLLVLFRTSLEVAAQWCGLIGVILATAVTIAIWEGGVWQLGLTGSLRWAVRETLFGAALAAAVILFADGLIMAFSDLRHVRGNGFPRASMLMLFLPAVLHEELLFRGYPFQKLWRWHRGVAIVGVSLLFAALHAGNTGVTALALLNIFLAGILLSLAYARYQRLWFPIGIHLGWNLLSGPVLGHEVSGYVAPMTLLRTIDRGLPWITGGRFGIEGSICMTVVELVAVAWLWKMNEKGKA